MSLWPGESTVRFRAPIKEQIEFKTLVTEFETGSEQRAAKRLFPRRNLTFQYELISKSEANTLWQFYIDRKGAYEAFNVFLEKSDTYTKEYVGIGDGSTTIYNLPGKNTTSRTIYLDGSPTGGYTFSGGGGTDGADKITFTVAPSDGVYITATFTGNLKVRSRFMDDMVDFDTFYRLLTTVGISMRGLLNE